MYEISNYDLFQKDRGSRGGGVCTYVRQSMNAVQAPIPVPPQSECLWVHLKKNVRRIGQILLCVLYYPPDSPVHDELINHVVSSVDLFRSTHTDCKVVIAGDFNGADKNRV